jgi:hypothetical protein
VSGQASPEELSKALFEQLRLELTPHDPKSSEPAPVLEFSLRGHLGFKSSLLEINRLRDEIKAEFGLLLVMIRNQSLPVEYAVATGMDEHITRAERERRVIEDLILRDARYKERASAMADLILEAKQLALTEEQPSRIAEMIEQRTTGAASNSPANLLDGPPAEALASPATQSEA